VAGLVLVLVNISSASKRSTTVTWAPDSASTVVCGNDAMPSPSCQWSVKLLHRVNVAKPRGMGQASRADALPMGNALVPTH
jgi:hypothetical protein